MARLISCATGNLTAATSWALSNSTALLDSEAGNTANTTAYVESSAFTPGAITIDGIAVKLASRVASPTGTASIRLAQGGALVAGTEVTVNVSDFPTCSTTNNEGGWVLFKFAAPVLLLAATAYTVSMKGSVNSEFNLYRDATAGNWSRQLRTTTTQAPVAGDTMDVMGEHTGAGTGNNITVTMDSTATTDYGVGTNGVVAVTVCKRGSLVYGATAATNYYLKLSGDLIVYNGGTFNQGTVGTPIPRDSTAILEFDPVADGGMGLIVRNGGTYTSQGLSRSSGKNIYVCKLSADASATNTSITVDTDTGWLSGDQIVIAKTSRSAGTQTELRTLNGAAGASSIAITAGLTNAHLGTSPRQAHIGLLTRNVILRSASSTIVTYVNIKATATVDIDWTEFYYLGDNVAGKRGIEIETTSSGSFNMQYSSVHDTEDWGFYVNGSATDNYTVSNNVFYNLNTAKAASIQAFQNATTTGTIWTMSYLYFFACSSVGASNPVFSLADVGGVTSNIVVADTITGASFFVSDGSLIGTLSDVEIYGGQSAAGFQVNSNGLSGTITNLKVWNISNNGLNMNATVSDLTFSSPTFFGNSTNNIFFGANGFTNLTFSGMTVASTTAATTTNAILTNGNCSMNGVTFTNCSFGIASGIYTAHTNDMNVGANNSLNMLFTNCNFGGSTLVANQSNLTNTGEIKFHKHNQTENNHLWYGRYGIARSTGAGLADTTVRTSGSLGVRMAPTNATTGFIWEFNTPAKVNSIVNFFGYFQKNAAFGSDVVTVELYLPGSTTADATTNLSSSTGVWQAASLSANYTGTVDGLATVRVIAKTTTSAAYLYIDDLFNGGDGSSTTFDKVTGLDTWYQGKPLQIIGSQALSAADVWTFSTTSLTSANTTGKQLMDALTIDDFIGLK